MHYGHIFPSTLLTITLSMAIAGQARAESTDRIRKSIQSRSADFLACYHDGGMKSEGRVVVRFTLLANGSVENASIEKSELHDKGVEDCVLSVLQTVDFPQSEELGSVTVNYPFVFKRK